MKYLEKYLDYLPLFPVFGFLLSLPGGALRLHNPYYFLIGLVTIPVWVLLIMAAFKIRKSEKQKASLLAPPLARPAKAGMEGKRGEGEGGGK